MKVYDFLKMSGAGNDFILIDNRKGCVSARSRLAARLCQRKDAVGADGLILMETSKTCDVRMRILNPDGSEADMCGNGVRCLAEFAVLKGFKKNKIRIETGAGPIVASVKGDTVRAVLTDPQDLKLNFELLVGDKRQKLHFINTGVPHAVQMVETLKNCEVNRLGRAIRNHVFFAPKGTNVNFVAMDSPSTIRIRTYERGVEAETLACGTGSTAGALVAAALWDLKSPVKVRTWGGEDLKVYFERENQCFTGIKLEGPVKVCFQGRIKA